MCKTKMAVNASNPTSTRTRPSRSHSSRTTGSTSSRPAPTTTTTAAAAASSSSSGSSYNIPYTSTTSSGHSHTKPSSSSISSRTSLSSLRESLPENPHIYDISEIRAATNNFLAKYRSSSSSSTPSWRCNLRGKDCMIFQRKFRRKLQTDQLRERLSVICRSHHVSIAKLLGVSISGDHIYLVYNFVEGASLADCLRNSKNPNFTVLSSWISRMQIATDLAHGLDYIHNNTGLNMSLVHKHIKSTSVIVTEPSFNAKICHFGTAQLCGEVDENDLADDDDNDGKKKEIISSEETELKKLTRSNSGISQFEGVRGYMSPEFQATGIATQKSDVYAFGVVILELLSGEEPFKYKLDKRKGDFVRTSVIDTARAAVDGGGDDGVNEISSVDGRLRKWVDRRMRDSFPVEVAGKLTRLALDCVHVDPNQRPNMGRVAGKISRLYLESRIWFDNLKMPTDFSVSLAPR